MDAIINIRKAYRRQSQRAVNHAGNRMQLFFNRCVNFLFVFLLLNYSVPAHSNEQPKRILLLIPYNITYPGVVSVAQSAIQQLTKKSSTKLELLPEFLDLARFPEAGHEALSARYLAEKYTNKKPDIVITVGRQASRFILKYRDSIAPDVPVVLCCLPAEIFAEITQSPNVTGIISARDITKTLDLAQRLQPAARRLVVIAGATPFDKDWIQIAQQQIERHDRRFDTKYLIGVPYEQLMREVANLPPDTIVITLTYFSDENGIRHVSPEVIRAVAKASSAPVYSPYTASFGYGLVGGFSILDEAMGSQLAELALEILEGKEAAAIAPQMSRSEFYRVDQRQLDRWRFSARNLPAGTIVSFQKPSLWDEYRSLFLPVIAAFICLLGIFIYVTIQSTRRLRAERSLNDSETRMAFAAVSTNSGLWRLQAEDAPMWVTDYCRTLFDLPVDALVTLDRLLIKVHPDDRIAVARTMRSAIRNGDPLDCEFRIVCQDGKIRWIAAKGQSRREGNGQPIIVNGLFTDVTALKEVEQAAEIRRKEVEHLMRQSVLNELSGSIAHELNQPLTAILSNAEAAQDLLGRKVVDIGKVQDIINDIIEEDSRAAEVISRVRRLLRKGDGIREAINIGHLIESTLTLLHGEFLKRRIAIIADYSRELPTVSGDPVQLQQVLINLLVNSMEAMDSTPSSECEIKLEAFYQDGWVKIVVRDSGNGIPTEFREKLFEPFASTKKQGLGLGLSICVTILKSHAGEIVIENNADRGATAVLTLPAQGSLAAAE